MGPLWFDRSANSVCDMKMHGQGGQLTGTQIRTVRGLGQPEGYAACVLQCWQAFRLMSVSPGSGAMTLPWPEKIDHEVVKVFGDILRLTRQSSTHLSEALKLYREWPYRTGKSKKRTAGALWLKERAMSDCAAFPLSRCGVSCHLLCPPNKLEHPVPNQLVTMTPASPHRYKSNNPPSHACRPRPLMRHGIELPELTKSLRDTTVSPAPTSKFKGFFYFGTSCPQSECMCTRVYNTRL